MTISGHIAVTGLTLAFVPEPSAIIAANLLIHPLLDMIPHAEWYSFPKREEWWKMGGVTSVDILTSIWLVDYFLRIFTTLSPFLIFGAILAGLWLDILHPFLDKFYRPLWRFHIYCHTIPTWFGDKAVDWSKTISGKTPVLIKLAFQIGLVLIAYLILNQK
ncbi:hypothetical protein HYW32_00750 [Candidatus Berkelbacteria bacterium]|nr:hypothetical protein [Candidatus Berkelbacteria bacterium]